MPRVTPNGQVTIPKEIREDLDIEPGDEIIFERTNTGYKIRKAAPSTTNGEDPFDVYRGIAKGDQGMPERMRRLRGEYPRPVSEAGDPKAEDS